MTDREKWELYEAEKQFLREYDLPAWEYEERLREIAEALGI